MNPDTLTGGGSADFPSTHWTLVRSARRSPQERRHALGLLLASYWKPLFVCARRRGLGVEDSKDAVQDFCAHAVETALVEGGDSARGRFRSYLRTAFENHLAHAHERRRAAKRGGGVSPFSIDDSDAEQLAPSGAQGHAVDGFDREWALTSIERALDQLRAEFSSGIRVGPFEAFVEFFRGQSGSITEAADRWHLSPTTYKAFIHRARVRFREIVRDLVTQTLDDPAEIDREIADLITALSG